MHRRCSEVSESRFSADATEWKVSGGQSLSPPADGPEHPDAQDAKATDVPVSSRRQRPQLKSQRIAR